MSATLNFHIEPPTEKQPFTAEATHFEIPKFVSLDLVQGEVSVQLFLRDRKSAQLILDAVREAVCMLTPKPPTIGVPFASNVLVVGADKHYWAKQCPECEMAFMEYEKKDEESYTGSEYVQHYIDVHKEK